MHITRAFLDGMKEIKSINVNMINTIDKKINYCKGCFTCKKKWWDMCSKKMIWKVY